LEKAIAQARSEVIGRNVICGDYSNHLEPALAKADWVIEAIAEDIDTKRDMYTRIEPLLNDSTLISSTTSSLPLTLLAHGRSATFQRRFLGTHFYNPPGRMLACETTGHDGTDLDLLADMNRFLVTTLGRQVVPVENVAAFAGNRIAFLIFARAVSLAQELGVVTC